MKNSRFITQNRNFKAFVLFGFLFAGSTSFAQTTQAEPVKAAELKTEVSEYPTDPVLVPADLKKHAIEQKTRIKSISVNEGTPKKRPFHGCPSF